MRNKAPRRTSIRSGHATADVRVTVMKVSSEVLRQLAGALEGRANATRRHGLATFELLQMHFVPVHRERLPATEQCARDGLGRWRSANLNSRLAPDLCPRGRVHWGKEETALMKTTYSLSECVSPSGIPASGRGVGSSHVRNARIES
jgi:hypothetical protein